MLTAFFELIRDFIYPPQCPVCGAYLAHRGDWCEECLAKALDVRRLKPDSFLALPSFDEAWALGRYRGFLRNLILPLKYHGQLGGLPSLATFLGRAFAELPPSVCAGGIVAVPIPLHRDREDERGFNQTELIFRGFLAARGVSWQRALVRVRHTAPQYKIDAPNERLRNVIDAFSMADGDEANVSGRRVLLVDDIYTTGSTMAEAARVLCAHGAAAVVALALASDH